MKAAEFVRAPVPKNARVFIVSGAEAFLRNEVIEHVLASFGDATVDSIDVTVATNAPPPPPNTLLDDLMTRDLFGGARVILVRDADAFVKAHAKVLGRFFGEGTAVHPVIFEGQSILPKSSKGPPKAGFAGAIFASGGVCVSCAELYDSPFGGGPPERSPLSSWVQQRAQRYGKTLSLIDAYHLHRSVGTTLGSLDGELQKLALACGDRRAITLEDIERLVGETRQTPVFELGEKVSLRDLSASLEQSVRLFENGIAEANGKTVRDPVAIAHTALRIIASKVQKVLLARELMDAGAPFEEASAAVGTPPFAKDRMRMQVEAWRDPVARRRLLQGMVALERGLKGSGGPPRVLIDRFLVTAMRQPSNSKGDGSVRRPSWRR